MPSRSPSSCRPRRAGGRRAGRGGRGGRRRRGGARTRGDRGAGGGRTAGGGRAGSDSRGGRGLMSGPRQPARSARRGAGRGRLPSRRRRRPGPGPGARRERPPSRPRGAPVSGPTGAWRLLRDGGCCVPAHAGRPFRLRPRSDGGRCGAGCVLWSSQGTRAAGLSRRSLSLLTSAGRNVSRRDTANSRPVRRARPHAWIATESVATAAESSRRAYRRLLIGSERQGKGGPPLPTEHQRLPIRPRGCAASRSNSTAPAPVGSPSSLRLAADAIGCRCRGGAGRAGSTRKVAVACCCSPGRGGGGGCRWVGSWGCSWPWRAATDSAGAARVREMGPRWATGWGSVRRSAMAGDSGGAAPGRIMRRPNCPSRIEFGRQVLRVALEAGALEVLGDRLSSTRGGCRRGHHIGWRPKGRRKGCDDG